MDIKTRIMGNKDSLFIKKNYPKPFAFNQEVADVFDDMVTRSIPLYDEVIRSVVEWGCQAFEPGCRYIDIGCSTGITLDVLLEFISEPCHAIGIDPSAPMLKKAEQKLKRHEKLHKIELIENNALSFNYNKAKMVILNYTLQFIPVTQRKKLLTKIYNEILPGAIVFISDKIRFDYPEIQEITTYQYESFKERQGYSTQEIIRKKEALENVLVSLTYEEQIKMLKEAGFQVTPILQWNHFISFIARKDL